MASGNQINGKDMQINVEEDGNGELVPHQLDIEPDVEPAQRKVRGPTRMREIWGLGEGERLKIEVNEVGQPIDEKKKGKKKKTVSKMVHFMGCIVKSGKHAEVYQQWNQVDDTTKQDMVDLVKAKFDLPAGCETWILQSFAKKLRNYRATLKKDYYDATLSYKQQRKKRPKHVNRECWKQLLKYWNREDAQKTSEQNKANRQKKKMTQTTGKKNFARAAEEQKEELGRPPTRMERFMYCYTKKDGTPADDESAHAIAKMKEERAKLPEGAKDDVGPHDIFSKVIGKDKDGRAKMYGLGASTSDLWGLIPSRAASYRMSMELKETGEQMKEKINDQARQLEELRSKDQRSGGSEMSASNVPTHSAHRLAPRSAQSHESPPLKVGSCCNLKSIINPTEVVAKGWVHNLDPLETVGGEVLGPNWCEVNVQVAVKKDEHLVRPYGFIKTIEDAIGATIAWPCPFIEVVSIDDADWGAL